jgi:hypothetical protein
MREEEFNVAADGSRRMKPKRPDAPPRGEGAELIACEQLPERCEIA